MLRRAQLAAVPLLAFGLFCAAAAQVTMSAPATTADPGGYSITQSRAVGSGPTMLAIGGMWPTPCAPTFETAKLAGADLRVDARTMLGLCANQPTPFSIEVNPALALGLPELAAGIYHVSFYAANGAQAEPRLRAFSLIDTTHAATPFTPETGFWWTTSTEHGGGRNVFSLELQGSQLSAALLSYDRDGRGNWQFGTAQLDGRVAHIPLIQLAGGSDPLAAVSTVPRGEAGLMLDLEFHSNALATAWLSRSGSGENAALQLQTMQLVRLPFEDAGDGSAWQGDWILLADEKSPPQRLRLSRVPVQDADRFRLADAAVGVTLDCQLETQNEELPPTRCTAVRSDGSVLGRFDAVAITRMDGTRADGAAVHLVRVSP